MELKFKYIKDADRDIFILFLVAVSVYYCYRMFAFAPWYDELYTYNFFISRGPVYAGIHWPVPNNHMGYSVLGGVLYVLTHNPFLSLRGISFLCSVGNLIMLYMVGTKLFKKGFAPFICAVYAGSWLVNNTTVQGRGYALSANMMMLALICLIHIAFDEKVGRRYYVLWAFSMILGFYDVMTTLYWVVTLCVLAGVSLLGFGKVKRLIHVVISSVCAAFGTLLVYSVVWLAIGSNLLSKDPESGYFGLYQLDVIKMSPVRALLRGAGYMLDTPYIQSVPRDGYLKAFFDHFLDIFNHIYGWGSAVMVLMALAVISAGLTLISGYLYGKKIRTGGSESKSVSVSSAASEDMSLIFLSWMVICFAVVTPIVVFIQCKLPYVRTFMFYSASVAVSVSYFLYMIFGSLRSRYLHGLALIACALMFALIMSSDYNMPYGDREESVYELMKTVDLQAFAAKQYKVCLTDCNQEYMYRFVYDEYPAITDMSEADIVVLDKEMLDPDAEYHWEFYYDYASVDHDRLDSMKQLLRNTYYAAYCNDEINGGMR